MQAVIFDMDGVIVDTEPLTDEHHKQYLQELGADLDAKPFEPQRGMNSRGTWEVFKTMYGLEHDIDFLIESGRERYMEHLKTLDELPIIDGVSELIHQLHATGYRIGLASSSNPKRIKLFLNQLGLTDFFEVTVSGDDVKHGKPAPDCYLLAAKKLGVNPEDCVVIEDATFGVRAAKSAGMKCLGFAGLPHNDQDLSEADLIITDFHKLANFVKTGGGLLDL
ncbi:HAD family phosphatase [Patescibacteria group bacterium]|nr:MAG: HAD family phosphatase [Patescibacteria group bacterium]